VKANYVLYGKDKKKEESDGELGVPPTLPPELKANVKPGSRASVGDSKGQTLSLEELVNPVIQSASNRAESAQSAPALVIVLTAKDLRDRGYTEFSQILDDLPGMDVVRPYGDIYVKSYWRGSRPGTGADPYLIMLDGVVFNHLFFRDTQIMATFPLTSIERVEVVYGPASAVYGANAAMGVINVITKDGKKRQESGETGTWLESRQTVGGAQRNFSSWRDLTRQLDATLLHVNKDFRFRLTARIEDSVLDRGIGDNFEYTKPKYYSDARIWPAGLAAAYPDLSGSFRSPDNKRAVDARFYVGNAELGAQLFTLSTGLGTKYPADRQQTSPLWTTSEFSLFGRHTATLALNTVITSLIQYRRSNITSPSSSLSQQPFYTSPPIAGAELASVEVPNSGLIMQEDLSLTAGRSLFIENDSLSFGAGLKYQHLELSNDYRVSSSTIYPLTSTPPFSTSLNTTPPGDPTSDGRLQRTAEELGAYALARYAFPAANTAHLGIRYDRSSLGDLSAITIRGGYVGTFDPLTVKLLYGQAVYAPSTYDLALAELDSSRGKLEAERSQTIEANVSASFDRVALFGDSYYVSYAKPIVGGYNLDDRHVAGADAGARVLFQPIMLWAYYSRYFVAEESRKQETVLAPIGDLAFNKVWGGVTFDRSPVVATVLGRWIGGRDTVATNPISHVDAYFTLDANLTVSRVFFDGMWVAFRGVNLTNATYFQPGTGLANSGVTPGTFSASGAYKGSAGYFNSLHPQPGRTLLWTIGLDL
jgi:outer membrane receptor protein involved in Fe transport